MSFPRNIVSATRFCAWLIAGLSVGLPTVVGADPSTADPIAIDEPDDELSQETEADAAPEWPKPSPPGERFADWIDEQTPAITTYNSHLFQKPSTGVGIDVDAEDEEVVLEWRIGF